MDTEHEKEVVLSRVIAAPREAVWQAWTQPVLITHWWGPRGTTIPEATFDPAPGGRLRIVMLAGPELGPLAGQRWPMEGIIKEAAAPERLSFTSQAVNESGGVLLEGFTTVELKEEAGGTLMTVVTRAKGGGDVAAQMLAGMEQGWEEQLDKLAQFLAVPV